HRYGRPDRYAAGTRCSDVTSTTQHTCRGIQPLKGLGSSRINYRLWPLVFRLHGYRRRILCNVAVEGMERPGDRVPHHHSDLDGDDFCEPAGQREREQKLGTQKGLLVQTNRAITL